MWKKISEELPPEGKEVLFLLVNCKEKVLGDIWYSKEYFTERKIPHIRIKMYSTTGLTSREIREIELVTHWMEIPRDPPEEVIERFDLMDMD